MAFNKKPKNINPDEVDPEVYYYDEVYDEMKEDNQSVEQEKASNQTKEGSKYIKGLLETAELRRSEKEIRVFKKYARDREKAKTIEGVDDEDVYISSSYKKRLKEIEVLEAEKRKRLSLEKDNRMNFSKKSDVNQESDKEVLCESNEISDENVASEFPKVEEVKDNSNVERKSKPKLKTIEERRKFLRELLAKRTVGKTYDQAVQRYLDRKAMYR